MKTPYPYTSAMPVSAKFYTRIRERVHSVISALSLPDSDSREDGILRLIVTYLTASANTRPEHELTDLLRGYTDKICVTIFLTLKAEIDAAIKRSRRARTLAATRRRKQSANTTESTTNCTPHKDIPSTSAESYAQPESSAQPAQPDLSATTATPKPSATTAKLHHTHTPRHRYGIKFRPLSCPNSSSHPYPRKTTSL